MAPTSPATDGLSRPSASTTPPRTRLVVDAPTRMFHWLFALCFAGAYLTADGERWRLLHVVLGYTFAGLLGFRVLYGLLGPRPARLSVLVRKLTAAPAWWRSVRDNLVPPRPAALAAAGRQGQNLAMAGTIAGVLLLVLPLTLSGYATFHEWGGEWLEEVHEFFGNTLLALVLVHLGLLALLSLWRRQNMAGPMLTGRTVGAGPDLVKRPQRWLAAALLLAVLAYWGWEWQQAPNSATVGSETALLGGHRDHDDD